MTFLSSLFKKREPSVFEIDPLRDLMVSAIPQPKKKEKLPLTAEQVESDKRLTNFASDVALNKLIDISKNKTVQNIGSSLFDAGVRKLGLVGGGLVPGRKMKLMPIPYKPLVLMKNGGLLNRKLQTKGGRVRGKDVGNVDTISCVLAVNEIVIPRQIAMNKVFKNMLTKDYNYNQKKGKFNPKK